MFRLLQQEGNVLLVHLMFVLLNLLCNIISNFSAWHDHQTHSLIKHDGVMAGLLAFTHLQL